MRPSECKWCGRGVRSNWHFITFMCGTSFELNDRWTQSPECRLEGIENRIQRSIDTLKAAARYRVTPVSRTAVEWDTSDDGPVADSAAVDEALAILEGERE